LEEASIVDLGGGLAQRVRDGGDVIAVIVGIGGLTPQRVGHSFEAVETIEGVGNDATIAVDDAGHGSERIVVESGEVPRKIISYVYDVAIRSVRF
jgi:hypothetical protein